MKKFRLFLDARKEEKWLNEMIQKGWLCQKINAIGIYHFTKTPDTEQSIRLDFQSFPSADHYQDYLILHEDFGWKHIAGTRNSSLHYWLRPNTGNDELFSDNESEKAYYKRLSAYYGSIAFFCLFLTFILYDNLFQYTSIKSAYFTPGLWDMQGSRFLFSFLFETPFAFFRITSPWFLLLVGIAFTITYLRFNKRIKQVE